MKLDAQRKSLKEKQNHRNSNSSPNIGISRPFWIRLVKWLSLFLIPILLYGPGWFSLAMGMWQYIKPPAEVEEKANSCTFKNWQTMQGGIFLLPENFLSIKEESNLGYIISPTTYPEDAHVTTTFTPHGTSANHTSTTDEIDFFIGVENSFRIIVGDGDNRAIALKKYIPINPNWEYVTPKNFGPERHDRYYLKSPIPLNKEVTVEMDVDAPASEGNHRTVRVKLQFFGSDGKIIDTSMDGESLEWEFNVDGQFNGDRRYTLGIFPNSNKTLVEQPSVTLRCLEVTPK